MPSLSLNVGLNNGRKLPFGGGAAPSGIVVATTNIINVTGGPNILFYKQSPTLFAEGQWRLEYSSGGEWYFDDGDNTLFFCIPPATDPNIIPSNWNNNDITLTFFS
jgi:hypothetical protein